METFPNEKLSQFEHFKNIFEGRGENLENMGQI